MLSDHAVNYYASRLVRVKCYIDSFVDEDSVRYDRCECEDILIHLSWFNEEHRRDYLSPDEILTSSASEEYLVLYNISPMISMKYGYDSETRTCLHII